jgi:hypothetical protein
MLHVEPWNEPDWLTRGMVKTWIIRLLSLKEVPMPVPIYELYRNLKTGLSLATQTDHSKRTIND